MYIVTFHHRLQRVNICKRDTAGCRIIFSTRLAAGETNNHSTDSQNEEAFLFYVEDLQESTTPYFLSQPSATD